MFEHDFWQLKNHNKEITVGWLYNNNIKDDFAKGYTKNLTDYWSVELAHFFPTQFAEETVNDLLKKAYDNGFSSILVFKQGCTLRGPNFLSIFRKFLDKHTGVKFIGHILDREEAYYEIHPQTFFIDLKWWAEAGFPEWGERDVDLPLETLEPVRSEENHHDQYTPLWICPPITKNLKTYQGPLGEGWNMVKALIESGQKIVSWNKDCRISKQYAYAEVEVDAPRHRADLLEEVNQDKSCFVANTENVQNLDDFIKQRMHQMPDWNGRFQQVVTPASGISTLVYAFKLGLKAGDRIVIYDISKFAIEYTDKLIKEWDANTSYTEFVLNQKKNKHGNYKGIQQLSHTEELIDELNKEGFSEWVNNDLRKISIATMETDLYNQPEHKNFLKPVDPKLMTYFHFTNIFHYMPLSFYYSLRQKWQLSNDLIGKIQNKYSKNNNALINLYRGTYCNSRTFSSAFWIDDADTREFSEISGDNIFRLLKWNK